MPYASASHRPPPPIPAGPSDFTPFTPLVSSSLRPDAIGGETVARPNCGDAVSDQNAVSEHLDGCLAAAGGARSRVAAYLAGNPPMVAVDVVKKLLGNLLNELGNDKYRRVRLGNPGIKEAVADREGGLELFEAVVFSIGELFAVMDTTPGLAGSGRLCSCLRGHILPHRYRLRWRQRPRKVAAVESTRKRRLTRLLIGSASPGSGRSA